MIEGNSNVNDKERKNKNDLKYNKYRKYETASILENTINILNIWRRSMANMKINNVNMKAHDNKRKYHKC